jgi:hypothetical protein
MVTVEIRVLGAGDEAVLTRVAPDVFDHPINPSWAAEFLSDPRLHLVVALDKDTVVGFASGVHYLHPDKAPEASLGGSDASEESQVMFEFGLRVSSTG